MAAPFTKVSAPVQSTSGKGLSAKGMKLVRPPSKINFRKTFNRGLGSRAGR